MVAKKTNVRVPRSRRNEGKPWTRQMNVAFSLDWGRLSERKLRAKYGRTPTALYRHAEQLRLPPQSQGKVSVNEASRRLEVSSAGLLAVLNQCGPLAARSSYVRVTYHDWKGPRFLYVDFSAAETCISQHDSRSTTVGFYARSRNRSRQSASRFIERRGLAIRSGKFNHDRYPYDLLDEVFSGTEGPWCAVWRAVLAAGELPVARWFVALAVHDYVFGDVASREWFETVATKTSRDVVMPLVKQLRGPSVVRAERKSDVSRRRNRERAA